MSDEETWDGSQDEPFAAFLDELRELDPDLDGLEPGAEDDDLATAAEALGVSLPPSYRLFLQQHNGGTCYDTTLFSVNADDDFDLVGVNNRDREDGLPDHLLAFAVTVSGDIYCFDTQQGEPEAPVVLLDPEDGTLMTVATSFTAWLDRLPRLESELAEARGPKPMTVEEWEQFLQRERDKLRKLSQTPARELTMPDPEKIRADLGGKIPVDPRHLKPRE